MKQQDLETVQKPTQEFTQTGTPLSETGSTALINHNPSKKLADNDPDETLEKMVSLVRHSENINAKIVIQWHTVNGKTFKKLIIENIDGPNEDLQILHDQMSKSLSPAPRELIDRWLVKLDMLTVRQQKSEVSNSVMFAAYGEYLETFPADIVREAMQPKHWKFLPTISELEDFMYLRRNQRSYLMAIIRKAIR